MTLQKIFLNDKNAKTMSILALSFLGILIAAGTMEALKIVPPNVTTILATPFGAVLVGFVFLGGPIFNILKEELTKEPSGKRLISGMAIFLNSIVGLLLVNVSGLFDITTIPAALPLKIIAGIIAGNTVYSMFIEWVLKKIFR